MTEVEASRTLVKSPPELWAECSDAASLARHLGRFGEIRITRLDPETAVAWEGDHARGTVRIEPAGWGTKVILTAVAVVEEAPRVEETPPAEQTPQVVDTPPPEQTLQPEVAAESPEAVEEAPDVAAEPPEETPGPPQRRRRFTRLRAWLRRPNPDVVVVPVPAAEPAPRADSPPPAVPTTPPESLRLSELAPPPESPPPPATSDAEAALAAALDSLGQAHHRPFSRG